METFGKQVSNLLRGIVWQADYLLSRSLRFFLPPKRLPKVKDILFVELLFVGDTIATTPAVRALRHRFPDARITAMVLPGMEPIYDKNPNVDEVIAFSREYLKKNLNKVASQIEGKYDLGVVFHPGSWTVSMLLRKAEVKYRIGCTRVGFLESRGFFFHRFTRPVFHLKHKVEDNLDVVRTIGVDIEDRHLELYTSKDTDDSISELLRHEKINEGDFLVVIHASPQHKTHEWIPRRFAILADKLADLHGAKIIFTGGKKDRDYNKNIVSFMSNPALNLAGETTLEKFFSVIKQADLVISVDTSAMHVAAAFDKPIVALFGAGNPRIWRPYTDNAIVVFKDKWVCTSCMKHGCEKNYKCMKSITVDAVFDAAERLIKKCELL